MKQDPFGTFIELIKFDQETISLDKTIKKNQSEFQELKNQKKSVEDAIESIHTQMIQARKFVDEKELEMKDLDAQEKDQKKHLDNAHNQKEYESAMSEIAALKEDQLHLEDELIAAWNKLETIKKKYNHKKDSAQEEIIEIEKQITQKEQEIQEVQKQIATRDSERDDKYTGIPEEWLERYKAMRGRVSNPVVPVADGTSCGGCFYIIPPQDMARLEKKALLQCKACYRLLYMKQKSVE